LPTTATPTAETIFSKVSANHAACSGVIVACCSVVVMRSPCRFGGRGRAGSPDDGRREVLRPAEGDGDPLAWVAEVAPALQPPAAGQAPGHRAAEGAVLVGHLVGVVARRQVLIVEVDEPARGVAAVRLA